MPWSHKEKAWSSGQRVGLAIQRSRVRVPLLLLYYMDLFHGSAEFKSSATLINSQPVSCRPFGILNNVMFNLNCLFQFVCSAPLM